MRLSRGEEIRLRLPAVASAVHRVFLPAFQPGKARQTAARVEFKVEGFREALVMDPGLQLDVFHAYPLLPLHLPSSSVARAGWAVQRNCGPRRGKVYNGGRLVPPKTEIPGRLWMHTTHTVDDLLTTLAAVLGRCALMALGLIALWGLLLVFAPEFTFNIQRALLDITRPQFNLIHFGGLGLAKVCLLYTSDAADDLLCVDLGGRRIIKKKTSNL